MIHENGGDGKAIANRVAGCFMAFIEPGEEETAPTTSILETPVTVGIN